MAFIPDERRPWLKTGYDEDRGIILVEGVGNAQYLNGGNLDALYDHIVLSNSHTLHFKNINFLVKGFEKFQKIITLQHLHTLAFFEENPLKPNLDKTICSFLIQMLDDKNSITALHLAFSGQIFIIDLANMITFNLTLKFLELSVLVNKEKKEDIMLLKGILSSSSLEHVTITMMAPTIQFAHDLSQTKEILCDFKEIAKKIGIPPCPDSKLQFIQYLNKTLIHKVEDKEEDSNTPVLFPFPSPSLRNGVKSLD